MPNLNRPAVVHDAEKQRHEEKCALGEGKNNFAIGPVHDRAAYEQALERPPWGGEADD